MTAPAEWVGLARIRRPQGRKGEVFADILTDFPEKFAERRRLWLLPSEGTAQRRSTSDQERNVGAPRPDFGTRDTSNSSLPPREVELTHHWLHKGGIVLHFAGIHSISDAEALKGLIVAIPRAERAALTEGETYVDDLIGCMLVEIAGPAPIDVGVIESVDRSAGPAPLLVVRGAKGEVLVPFAKDYLRRIDLDAKRVEMSLPGGLIDLNASE